jgi:glycosyl transferase family 25
MRADSSCQSPLTLTKTETSKSGLWDQIDAVLVINLERNIDRWKQICNDAKDIIPQEKLHRLPAVPGHEVLGYGERPWFRGGWRADTWARRGGCVLAHRRALEMAHNSEWERVLILEDDAAICSDFEVCADELAAAIANSSLKWDVIYLGFTDAKGPFRAIKHLPCGRHLAQIFGCHCAHGYIVNKRMRDWLLQKLPDESMIWPWLAFHRAIDRWYSSHLGVQFNILAVSPPLINQRAGFSDILGRFSNDACGAENPQCVPIKEKPQFYTLLYFGRIAISYLAHAHNFLSACRKIFMGF